MASQLSSLYLSAYQLAYQLAKQVEACFAAERRKAPVVGISAGGWNGLRKGLLSGESLAIDLKRLESEFLSSNVRDPEFTKSVSLVTLSPSSLIDLKATGSCTFNLPELLFDVDHPGCYHRLIKSVSVTIPSVTGPYSGINGRLEYQGGKIRSTAKLSELTADDADNRGVERIILSNGQNDTGMFETNLRDDRYLPFEGRGLVDSNWKLILRQESNSFDLQTVSDVVLRIQYTALWTEAFEESVRADLSTKLSAQKQVRIFSLRHEFADSWHALARNGFGTSVAVSLGKERFPIAWRGKTISMLGCDAVAVDSSRAWSSASVKIGADTSTKSFKAKDDSAAYLQTSMTFSSILNPGELALSFPGAPSALPEDIFLLIHCKA